MNRKTSTSELTTMALLTALLCASAYIIIPLPFTAASFTAQTLIINMIAFLLLPRQAAMTIICYILLGFVGLPVFSGGMSGPGKLFGPTGGYIMSWLLAVVVMSWLRGKHYSLVRYCIVSIGVGMPLIYIVGSVYMKLVTGMDWMATLTAAVFPFIPLDIFKCVVAALLAKPVQSAVQSVRS